MASNVAFAVALLNCLAGSAQASLLSSPIPATPCSGVSCGNSGYCRPPFKFQSPEESGTCCGLCTSDVDVPEDRSWAKHLTGGVGADNNADPVLCRGVVCPPLLCDETQRHFDGRCCTKCKTSAIATRADFAASYKN
eukprot:TRINITY_DN56278_c0_g1_i1.p1 TRINITY_DN56278_c0_g1~~TRINITY_DN56278_c0_g1_i1.p1  ORF type:complete len:149 (-),score=22.56 TRINITY_DN56278_c0_g1_i1:61-471(-)